MDSLPPGHHPDWRTSVLLLIWGTASPGGFLGTGGSCLPRYAGAPREHGLAMLGAPGGLCWTGSPSTHQWAYPAHTRGSFRFTTKGTKGVPGAAPLDPGAWLPHFPRSLRFAPARAVLLPAFLPAALQARQHGGHIPPRLSPPPFGTLIACDFPFPYPAKKLLDARWGAQAVHGR